MLSDGMRHIYPNIIISCRISIKVGLHFCETSCINRTNGTCIHTFRVSLAHALASFGNLNTVLTLAHTSFKKLLLGNCCQQSISGHF